MDENPILTGSTRSESGRASATFEVETSGTYVLVIETTLNDNTGSYSITGVTLEDRIGDSFEAAQTILADGAVFESYFETLDDTDMFSFTLDEFAAVNLSVDFSNRNPEDLDGFLAANWVIFDEAGNQISENTNLLVAEAGTYYVALTNQTPDIASYGFSVERVIDDYAGDVSTQGQIYVDGEAISGNLDYEGDVDWISFTAEAGDNFYLTINSVGQVLEHPEIAIYDSNGELVIEFFSYDRFDLNYFLTVNVTGQYFIQIGADEFSSTPSGEYILYLETGGDGETDAGPENDVINGTSSGEVIAGYGGDDTLNGNGGDDTVLGGQGNDTLDGGAGNDDIRGGSGDDVMTGGLGVDKFYFSGLAGANRVTDFTVGEDMLILSIDSPYTSMSDLRDMMVQDGNDIVMSYGAGTIRLENVSMSELSLDSFRFATDHPDGPGSFLDPGRSYADIKQEEWDEANAAQSEKDEAPLVAEVLETDFENSQEESLISAIKSSAWSLEDFELRFDRILNMPKEDLPEWGEWL